MPKKLSRLLGQDTRYIEWVMGVCTGWGKLFQALKARINIALGDIKPQFLAL